MVFSKLTKTEQRGSNKKIYGFDIETANDNKEFVCASIWGEDFREFYYTKEEVINAFKKRRFNNSFIVATNLQFDFFGVFSQTEEIQQFKTLFRGSNLLSAKTYIVDNKYSMKSYSGSKRGEGKTGHGITFIDTGNYCMFSVQKMGEILKVPKLSKPHFLGRRPKNREEWEILKDYNLRDSEVSQKFMRFLFDSFIELGATPKQTIASTAMSLFRNKYLEGGYWRQKKDILLDLFEGYYGGRTETFKRGYINNKNYYDINSLYPSVMRGYYPDPNSGRVTFKNTLEYINKYEGMSKVDVKAPELKHPYLPFRRPDKLIFPTGTFTGWYTHFELRKAIGMGYEVQKVHKTHYYKKLCRPFKGYVEALYSLRKGYKVDNNPMELVVKLLLNSLYGKFGQKFIGRDNWIPANITLDELEKFDKVERIGDFFCIKETSEPSCFCIPIWASYTTAYARDKLFNYIVETDPYYCDTDSIITDKELPESTELGAMKLEMYIKHGIIVKPKMYALLDGNNQEYVKVKGVGTKLTIESFKSILRGDKITYMKFTKFKEAMRRGLIPNELQNVEKSLSLEDNKRIWSSPFNPNNIQLSTPLHLIRGLLPEEYDVVVHTDDPEIEPQYLNSTYR